MELLANVYDPRIPLSVVMLQLGFRPAPPKQAEARPFRRAIQLELPLNTVEAHEEPERWDGLS
jgi:hypothetical protein